MPPARRCPAQAATTNSAPFARRYQPARPSIRDAARHAFPETPRSPIVPLPLPQPPHRRSKLAPYRMARRRRCSASLEQRAALPSSITPPIVPPFRAACLASSCLRKPLVFNLSVGLYCVVHARRRLSSRSRKLATTYIAPRPGIPLSRADSRTASSPIDATPSVRDVRRSIQTQKFLVSRRESS